MITGLYGPRLAIKVNSVRRKVKHAERKEGGSDMRRTIRQRMVLLNPESERVSGREHAK